MTAITFSHFGVTYDRRNKNWYCDPEDRFFPYSPDYRLTFVARGYAEPGIRLAVVYHVTGLSGRYSDDKTNARLPLATAEDTIVVGDDGTFSAELSTDQHLPCPHRLGEADEYMATVEVEGKVLSECKFEIANLPPNPTDLLSLLFLDSSTRGNGYDDGSTEVSFTLQSRVNYPFRVVLGGYMALLREGEQLFEEEKDTMPACEFQELRFEPLGSSEANFTFYYNEDESPDEEGRDREYHVLLSLAGNVFFNMPLSKIQTYNKADELAPFVGSAHDREEENRLMPPDFAEMLRYMEKRAVFAKHASILSKDWTRRHLVLTGKRGTGKRTAARLLAQSLVDSKLAEDIYETDAIDLLDPTNGYSPNLENMLDHHVGYVIIINDAEALTLKGSVGVLNGMEILANKLKKDTSSTLILLGKKGRMEELVNLCEPARELFYTFYTFEDVTPQQMLCHTRRTLLRDFGFTMTDEAARLFELYLERAYSLRGNNFSNMYFARRVVDDEIIPRMVKRTISDQLNVSGDVNVITAADIPQAEERDPEVPLRKLESLIGLDGVKKSIINHTSLVRLNKIRADHGLFNRMPPMHMVFTGNPGTGKTTIAEYLGEIYRGIGALSIGHLVQTDRSKLVGQYIGDTEKNTLNAIQRASGGVLFIDEAYNLFVRSDDNRDFGMRVIETLLTYLSMEDTDMIVILAGYTNEMKAMLESNPGLKSRFPYIFHFDDYSPEQLLGIGKLVLQQEQYRLTPEAEKALTKYIIEEYNQKDEHFGNGRFITRLLKSHIIPSLSQRLAKLPPDELTPDRLSVIEVEDIPRHDSGLRGLQPIDETILTTTLMQLDGLVGVESAKRALHDYVTTMRIERDKGTGSQSRAALYWNFVGNTGTGKSTVAELLAKLMQGLGLLKRGHLVTLNIEELTSGDMYKTIEKSLKRAADGLLFMDMDSPHYRQQNTDSIRLWIVNKIKETRQQTAVVFAETGGSLDEVISDLASNGISSLSHNIVFADFTADELMALIVVMLRDDHSLTLDDEALAALRQLVDQLHRTASHTSPVNARTMQILAQNVSQTARLRMSASGDDDSNTVTAADVAALHQAMTSHHARIGF